MIHIQKKRTPAKVKQEAIRIMNAPENGYKKITLPRDVKKLRSLFEQLPKNEISQALCQEQHGLCAYCMKKIETQGYNSMRIEHYKALSADKEGALDYQNYLGVCNGGEKEKTDKPHVLCCDAARNDQELIIDPRNKRQMEAIAYKRNGQIYVREDMGLDVELVEKMQNDIDNILVLNGIKDEKGKMKYDTASQLVAKRRSTYDSVKRQFERWGNKKLLTSKYLKEKIELLENQLKGTANAMEFIGIRLYFYKDKYKRLGRQGK